MCRRRCEKMAIKPTESKAVPRGNSSNTNIYNPFKLSSMSVNTVSKIDNIKDLYSQVKKKSVAINEVAETTGKSYGGVKNNWLCDSGGWSIPEENQDTVITVLQNVIKNQ